MDLYSIDKTNFRSIFFRSFVFMLVMASASWVLVNNNYIILHNFDPERNFTLPILLAAVVLSGFYGSYHRKQLNRLQDLPSFEEKVEAYEKLYRLRMRWFVGSCMLSCFLAVLTARPVFTYLAFFDALICLPYYPTALLFRKELRNDEIILY
jgi:hypothetical protein